MAAASARRHPDRAPAWGRCQFGAPERAAIEEAKVYPSAVPYGELRPVAGVESAPSSTAGARSQIPKSAPRGGGLALPLVP